MVKNLKKHLVWIFFIFLAVIGTIFAITAQDNAGKIEISKTATKMITNDPNNNLVYGRKAKVELNVKANPYNKNITTYDKLDVVLVLDSSGSMGDNNKLTNLKGAARDLVNTLMNDGTNQVGVVEFGTNVKRIHQLTTNKNNINRFINRMSADGGTNVQQAVASANTILQDGKRDDAQQIVIILTDGIPTFFNYNGQRYGTGSTDDSVCVERGWMGCLKQMKPSEAAKTELDKLKSGNKTADVYTIVFGNDEDAKNILATINPEQEKPLYKNYNALSGEDLKKMFQTIIEESVGRIGNNSVLTDIIPKEFKLTNASKTRLIQQGVEIIDNVDGTTTLKWNIGNIDADIDYKLSYEVRADENYHGSMYTNENATLTTTVSENNPYYENTDLTLTFDKPAVEIPAITKNDHYNHNESYIGYSESTINGTSILNNDRNKNILENIHTGNTQTTAEDEIIIVTDDNTKANADGTYSIYKDGVLQGTLDMNEDGTFSFISEEGITGEVTFDYVIKTSINQNHETSFVISNTSKVTLKILERQKINITGTKTWNDDNNRDGKRPYSITVILKAGNKEIQRKTVTKDNNWSYTFENLYKYEKGHENDSEYEITYTVEEESVDNYNTTINGYNITNTHEIEKTQISGTKTWVDNNNQDGKRPNKIVVELYADGEYVKSQEVTVNDNWTYKFTNLNKYNNGKEITYTVKEQKVEGYTTSVDNNNNITNTHEIEKIQVNGTKIWNDENNKDGLRPEYIKVKLYANGEYVDEAVANERTNWSYNFKNLDKYSNGKEITYTVEEEKVDNYDVSYDNNSYDITNTHIVKTVTVTGTKTWKDENNKYGRPDKVTINLFADGVKVDSKEVTASNNWTYTFKDLPMYKDGKKITYTISEDKVKDYDTTYDGYNVTNTYNPELTKISGTKTWDDKDNQDGIRPSSITVKLYANGMYITSQEVTARDNWKYEFKDLIKYANGEEITYTVEEVKVDNYDVSYDDNSYDITNKHVPEVVSKTVNKVWNDDNNRDNIRPESIKVILKANGEKVKEATLNGNNNWTYTFNNLSKYDKGNLINYTVEEINVDGYTSNITKNNDEFTITNTHEIDTNNLVVKKVWKDNNNQDGKRPNSLNVKIIGTVDNKTVEERDITLTASNNFRYEFTDLPMNSNGEKITYTAEENMDSDTVKYYTEETPIYENNTITLTNVHEIEKTQVVGKKSWVDSNDKDGLRPESIKIILKANGKEVASRVISASDKGDNSNEWIYSFTDLDMYKDGEKIIYTVDEEVDSKTKEHYTKSYDENNKNIIVNTHNPKDVTVSGTKTWKDENNKYGRPESITINLTGKIGDETVIEKSTKASESTNWTYSFEGLPEYSKGKLINYTISEEAVRDYNTEYNGYDITNTYNPETINISGTKTWEDKDNQDGIRPESITVTLYDHLGNEVGETTATKATNWTYTFDNLPKYANGKEIKYTVKETSQINGYETIVKDFDITNKHTPETVSYKVTKVWNDNNNQDGIRPKSITVKLYKNGTLEKIVTISAANNWTYTFKDLPKYYGEGKPVIYEIVEDVVKGYTSNVSQDKETSKDKKEYNGTITNTHKVAKKNIKVTKTWKDNNNKINKRPESITVNVLKNGEFFKQIILTKDMNWMFILNNLDKFENGKEIIYTIEELKVKGYTTTYNGYNIINTLINKRSSNKVIPVIKGKVEITPPSTGIESNNDINLLEGLLITFLLVGTVVTPIRLIKNN